MMKLFAGYDCGGTKTRCVVADEKGNILSFAEGGPANFLSCGYEKAKKSIEECTEVALQKAGFSGKEKIYSAFFGSAAINIYSSNSTVLDFFKSCINVEYIGVNNDAYIAWYGTTFGKTGIISISGTGAVTIGICEDGRWKKAGGWGYLIGDEGSGFYIGKKAIQLATKSCDGRIKKNRLEKEIVNFLGLKSMEEIKEIIYKNPQQSIVLIGSLAKCVFKLFEEKDELAINIIGEAIEEIALAIRAVYKHLNLESQFIKIGLSGGVFQAGGKDIIEMLNRTLKREGMKNYELTFPIISPPIAALLLAYEQVKENNYEEAKKRVIDKFKKQGEIGK